MLSLTCFRMAARALVSDFSVFQINWNCHNALWEPYVVRRVHKLHRLFLCISSMQRSILTLQPQMGYRWNRLDPRNSKMSTEKSGTGSVRFYNRFSVFKILSLPIHLTYCTLILT